jgi:hypothetical protein
LRARPGQKVTPEQGTIQTPSFLQKPPPKPDAGAQ